jgi:hypothetical protein
MKKWKSTMMAATAAFGMFFALGTVNAKADETAMTAPTAEIA